MFRFLAAASAVALIAASSAWAQPAPASAFGRLPAIDDAAISPDGKTIAIVGGAPGRRFLSMSPLDAGKAAQLDLGTTRVGGVQWVDDRTALINVVVWETVDKTGYNFERNILVGADGKAGATLLTGLDGNNYLVSQPVLGVTPGDKPYVSVYGLDWNARALSTRDSRISTGGENPLLAVVWRASALNGKGVISERGTPDTDMFDVDLSGEARVRRDGRRGGGWLLFGRPKGQAAWKQIYASKDYEDFGAYRGYSDAEDAVYMGFINAAGEKELVRLSLADGSQTVVWHGPDNGSARLIWDDYLDKPIGVVTERDTQAWTWFDTEIGAAHGVFARAFKGKRVTLREWSRDRTRFIAEVQGPDSPPAWYLYDKPRKELSPLGDAYPELADVPMGQTRFLTYKARDGLEIPAYLTLPPGAPAEGGKLPLIVLPHGGPASRDTSEFDWLTQYLATRGYAVLRPQFRGSDGFGEAFEEAGRREWGGKVQTDLLDGVADLAARGTIDAGKVCIVGASFGGYSALAGAALHPEAYRCAVSVAGVSDLAMFLGEARISYGKDSDALRQWTSMIGRVSADQALIRAWSPAAQAASITAPVLLIHGEYDTTVSPIQSTTMRTAMQAARKDVQSITLAGDDHYLSYSATRTQTLEAIGAFLAKHLPVK